MHCLFFILLLFSLLLFFLGVGDFTICCWGILVIDLTVNQNEVHFTYLKIWMDEQGTHNLSKL
jgi:hypothetical protein